MKQFKNKDEFNAWIDAKESMLSENEQFMRNLQTGGLYTDDEIVEMLKADGYTELNDLTANGEGYVIGGYTNGGWVHVNNADISHCIECDADVRDDDGHRLSREELGALIR